MSLLITLYSWIFEVLWSPCWGQSEHYIQKHLLIPYSWEQRISLSNFLCNSITGRVRERSSTIHRKHHFRRTLCCLFSPCTDCIALLLLCFDSRSTIVLVLLVFCICFLVACIMYLHVTRVQVSDLRFYSCSSFWWLCLVYPLEYEAISTCFTDSESEIYVLFKFIFK